MLSNKTQLCIEALIHIASAPLHELVTVQSISERLGVSISHAEGMMKLLREGGFVQSVRGPGGGYRAAQDPDQINVWAVIRAVGMPDESEPPKSVHLGLTHALEGSFHDAIQRHLAARTIGEFVQRLAPLRNPSSAKRLGFGLGPKPHSLMPAAPNSVFQLSSFLQCAVA